jgi:hypothetical protein
MVIQSVTTEGSYLFCYGWRRLSCTTTPCCASALGTRGLIYDENGQYWIPDRDADELQLARGCIQHRENGLSWRAIGAQTSVNKDTARRIYARRERSAADSESN